MEYYRKRWVLVLVISTIVLLVVFGITFAFFNYSRVSENQILVTGEVFMKYNEKNALNITNAMPKEYVNGNDNYFEFTVEGVNNYSEDIWYQVILNHGDSNKTRNVRLKDELLLFKLVEVKDGDEEIIFDRMSYPSLSNVKIFVDTIPHNTSSNLKRTYRLYMWVSPLTKIGNNNGADYDMETWNNQVYASVKVTVQGDFQEKEAYSCFTGVEGATYNYDRNEEQVQSCTTIFSKASFKDWFTSEESPIAYCSGTGTSNGATMDEDALNSSSFGGYKQELIEIGILIENPIDNLTIGGYKSECSKRLVIPSVRNRSKVTTIGGNAFREKGIIEVNIPNTIEELKYGVFFGNNLTEVELPSSVKTIGATSFYRNKLTTLNIPSNVQVIGDSAFAENKLTSLIINQGVLEIGNMAFLENRLTTLNIPNSVIKIGQEAFAVNDLRSVEVGNGITYIADAAFAKNRYVSNSEIRNKNLESITIAKTCNEIRNIQVSPNNTNKYYPWLGGVEGYRKGTTIYGKGKEVCNIY